ncbi:MAG: TetR/AcrR family transcriptional regulator [Vulcanimicrobiaceae bacterium]
MAYDVVKTIRGRDYRYSVESYRDPQTGKVRNKWRYLGKAQGNTPPRRRVRGEETRSRLMAALERLLARTSWNEITAQYIAAEAHVAAATLYRYFHSRNAVLEACAIRADAEYDARLAELADIAETPAREHARLRAWTIRVANDPPGSSVLFALWASGASDAVGHERDEHRRRAFRRYLKDLADRGYVLLAQKERDRLAVAIALIAQAFSYRVVIGRRGLLDEESDALATAIERLVFAAC